MAALSVTDCMSVPPSVRLSILPFRSSDYLETGKFNYYLCHYW